MRIFMDHLKDFFFKEINIDSVLRRLSAWAIVVLVIWLFISFKHQNKIMEQAFWGAAFAGFFVYLVGFLAKYYEKEYERSHNIWEIYQDLLIAMHTINDNLKDFEEFKKNADNLWHFNLRAIKYESRKLRSIEYLEALNEIHTIYISFERINNDLALIKDSYLSNYSCLQTQKEGKLIKSDINLLNNITMPLLLQFTDRLKPFEDDVLNTYCLLSYILKIDAVNWLNVAIKLLFGRHYNKKLFENGRRKEKEIQLKFKESQKKREPA